MATIKEIIAEYAVIIIVNCVKRFLWSSSKNRRSCYNQDKVSMPDKWNARCQKDAYKSVYARIRLSLSIVVTSSPYFIFEVIASNRFGVDTKEVEAAELRLTKYFETFQ